MNVKLNFICPNCSLNLKNEGSLRGGNGEFRVYKNCQNPKYEEGSFFLIQCLGCFFIASKDIWEAVNTKEKPLD